MSDQFTGEIAQPQHPEIAELLDDEPAPPELAVTEELADPETLGEEAVSDDEALAEPALAADEATPEDTALVSDDAALAADDAPDVRLAEEAALV